VPSRQRDVLRQYSSSHRMSRAGRGRGSQATRVREGSECQIRDLVYHRIQ
jgi:hypothetical protein